jgi:hypothetical protein
MNNFLKKIGRTFRGNEYLEKGLITGTFRIAKYSMFSDVNNIAEYNCLNNEFARFDLFKKASNEQSFSKMTT